MLDLCRLGHFLSGRALCLLYLCGVYRCAAGLRGPSPVQRPGKVMRAQVGREQGSGKSGARVPLLGEQCDPGPGLVLL